MSGVAGGNRIEKADVQRTFDKYVKQILEKVPGFKKASLSGSVKVGTKPDYGDLDLVTWFEGDDKKEVKKRLISVATSQSDSIIVPFKSEKYTGKKYYNSGEIITVLFPIVGKQDEFIQVDNIIALSEEEHGFKNNFLDLPAEKQGLILGLAKVITLEEDPQSIFKRLGITDVPQLQPDEEFEFNLSSGKLSLRKVKLDNYKEVGRQEIWNTTNWGLIKQLFKDYKIDGTFEELLNDLKTNLKNTRSRRRIKGIFNSMVSIKSGEVGTPKGAGKQKALDAVNALLEQAEQKNVALYAGGFKPPHKAHFNNAEFLAKKADKLIIFIGPKIREGVKITAQQSKAIWEIYAKYLPIPTEIRLSEVTPVRDIYDFVDQHQSDYNLIITGALPEEAKKFAYFVKNKEKYPRVGIEELPRIGDEENKFSATSIRTSVNYLKNGEWIPTKITAGDKKSILSIATKNSPSEKETQMQEALDKTLDELFGTNSQKVYQLDVPKFNYKKPFYQVLSEQLSEIRLSKDNAVEVQGDLTGGTFEIGNKTYRYDIKNTPNPYKDEGLFYNIQFTPREEVVSTPTQDTDPKDYIKILSTMYKVIVDFVEKERPKYIGISSLDSNSSKNYHLVYNALTDPKNNHLPGYFRKDTNLPFETPQGTGRFVVLKRKKQEKMNVNSTKNEGSSGTAIAPQSAIRSADRAKLVRVYNQLRNVIGDEYYDISFNQDHIIVKNKGEDQHANFDYTPYMGSILEYMIDEGQKITPLPEIKIRKDIAESSNFFGKTAYYNPADKEIVLYVQGRHPKDVMRSFVHEMIHHKQNLEGRLGSISTTNTNEDVDLLEIEKEAYLDGNITFRNWEDSIKNVD